LEKFVNIIFTAQDTSILHLLLPTLYRCNITLDTDRSCYLLTSFRVCIVDLVTVLDYATGRHSVIVNLMVVLVW